MVEAYVQVDTVERLGVLLGGAAVISAMSAGFRARWKSTYHYGKQMV
jgi:hypothetical protein